MFWFWGLVYFYAILIKITQNHCLVTVFLQNGSADFDETLHVHWACPGEGFSTIGTSGYRHGLEIRRFVTANKYYENGDFWACLRPYLKGFKGTQLS